MIVSGQDLVMQSDALRRRGHIEHDYRCSKYAVVVRITISPFNQELVLQSPAIRREEMTEE